MQQVVLPIKDSNVLKEVQDMLLHNFKAGRPALILRFIVLSPLRIPTAKSSDLKVPCVSW